MRSPRWTPFGCAAACSSGRRSMLLFPRRSSCRMISIRPWQSSFKISEQNIVFLRLVELLISVAAITLIIVEALWIFAPLVRTLRSEHEKTAAQQDKLQVQSRLDGLTGLGNRLAFEEQLLLKIDQCRRTQSPLGPDPFRPRPVQADQRFLGPSGRRRPAEGGRRAGRGGRQAIVPSSRGSAAMNSAS